VEPLGELVGTGTEGEQPGRDAVRGTLRLARMLRELEPSLVVSWMYHASLLDLLARPLSGRARRTQMVWFLQGSLHSLAGLPWHTRATVRILARRSHRPDAVAINSRAGRVHHTRAGYRPRRWILLPNGCDTTFFRPDLNDRRTVRSELGIAADALVAITVARNHPQKDHATLLAAVRAASSATGGLELMLVAATIAFVAFSRHNGTMDGNVFVFFILTVAAAEVAVGLAIIVALFRRRQTVQVEALSALRN
jgi:NADH:ubiquinone oxidoreductase subunit K